ncbi:Beta-galactosidase/beta-glucuronidase [Paenibacillus sp. OK060]|uniref:glycoside hydrolase family 2 TIM barrel-domain containing protein n=1 Tax=Paenibacillus sp. OK060 TaxID=1881034 RepID=UPI000888A279|nr:glycoside hydrolase family 2 TIM barrel-domain containing protein [Paenibacillus sp. OK060]SDK21389.1 Beta-galactosidase/beta-glucuronidase [Paenibacillus sp. OK060]
MLTKMNLQGSWELQLDEHKQGAQGPFDDTITLPNTTSHARKGRKNDVAHIGSLTDEYAYEGWVWLRREIDIPSTLAGKKCSLYLERTRITKLWVDGEEVGAQDSLNTPHVFILPEGLSEGIHTLTIRVDNTDYPTKGGHLTSVDTQTNWNGITGKLEIQFYHEVHMGEVQIYPNAKERTFRITSTLSKSISGTVLSVTAQTFKPLLKENHGYVASDRNHVVNEQTYPCSQDEVHVLYNMGDDALLWSDSDPHLYVLTLTLMGEHGDVLDTTEIITGLRDFEANGDAFTINGRKTFPRGKHDGLIFPLTGYAPTDVDEWLQILSISKSYGINHYRFHTCCPPEAAFTAADMLGIYMEPELPFWGTITDELDPQHNQAEQDYLIREGFAMLKAFGNHPSFVMMSLGNELWGSKERLNAIIKAYRAFDPRPLYTQGSNNFQFTPLILEEEDFYCGVRFSKDRLFRGSYAMCDAPLGHVQTDVPGTLKDYDDMILPVGTVSENERIQAEESEIQIQYGTEAKIVKAASVEQQLIPHLPVISHEIGQYAMYPNYEEIEKYTGSLKAKNFEVFRERLQSKGMGHLAEPFFKSSGKLAVACYKEELEAAFRSNHLAGFQLLDLQDFSGQGTALVGILDAFMDPKGLVTPEEWRTYCSDAVLLARFEKFNYNSGEDFNAHIQLRYYRADSLSGQTVEWEMRDSDQRIAQGKDEISFVSGETWFEISQIKFKLPDVKKMTPITLSLHIPGTDIRKQYDQWVYPDHDVTAIEQDYIYKELSDEVIALLEKGESVLLLPTLEDNDSSVEGTYCTDFWCYPMFRSISESMNKQVPVGTLGLLINNSHPALKHFPSENHSTYPWWHIVMNSRSIILDKVAENVQPFVQTIDNFERNHKLGLLFECQVGKGKLLVGALHYEKLIKQTEGRQLLYSLAQYVKSEDFQPEAKIELDELQQLLGKK